MKHGLSETRLYKIWSNMKQRCYNENATSYNYYGEKGITICDKWLNDFQAFYDWSIENGYQEDLTIDRIDSNKGYCPENCRWITLDENSRRGKSERVENDITRIRNLTGLSQSHFCEKYHIPLNTFARWEQGKREPPDYLVELLEFKVREDLEMVSEEYVICPYCKANHSRNDVIGTSGLINYCGSEFSMTCKKCGKDFYGEYTVKIKYRTRKDY